MPKNGKRGKKGGKKGGEKTESTSKTKSQESVLAFAAANSKLWETRLGIAEASRNGYKDCAHRLAVENEEISNTMIRNEKDMVDVISFLKDKLTEQQKVLDREQEKSRVLRVTTRQEIETLIEDFTKKINHLEEKLKERNQEIFVLKDELKFAKDFRRKRDQMQKDISDLKQTMDNANKIHREEFGRLEKKFLLEKIQIEKDSKKKINELTEKTHHEAVLNLDETTKQVFKENVRLKEALNLEMKQNEILKKEKDDAVAENDKLKEENKTNKMALKKKLSQDTRDKQQLMSYKSKVETLENSLTHVVREFDTEKSKMSLTAISEDPSGLKVELTRLQRIMELKSREMVKIKRLAKTILDQRTELENFFMSALEDVKSEIAKEKSSQSKMQTSNVSYSMFNTLDKNETQLSLNTQIDICELSWPQKERVLRHLFAKMNGQK
ncbi:hypothetical protein SNE40_023106 [Patella caerulea]|uniref:Basal body-orientation factor 1 n=1 Tax=Patella caerulea TaxID=87958 RepID=A0AAN8GHF4_PATCE